MAQTPNSTTAPYCDAATFLTFYAPQIVADVLRAGPDAPRPSYLAMLDSTNPAGAKLLKFLLLGSGEVEAACQVSKRYTPADLQGLTGASAALLQKLTAARTMWGVYQRLKPGSARPDEVPMARESDQLLTDLRNGEKIFAFVESQDAGLPAVVPANPGALVGPNVLSRAYRLFQGTYDPYGRYNRPDC